MSTDARDQQLEAILHDYLIARDRGERPEPAALLEAHPDLREDLAAYFADALRLERMAESLKTAAFAGGPVEASLPKVRYFGDYELLQEVARGGMGVVYRALQTSLNRTVALKMILKGELATEADVQRFRQEAEAAANLDHPNIVPIYEVGEHDGHQYFSMKLIAVARPTFRGERRKAAEILAKVARAVHHAHQRGILHRDLKPSNILIDQAGEPHVADFGLAKKIGSADTTRSGAIVGTPAYMAPEQARADKSLTTAADVYSLGAIFYEWLTGRPPFVAEDPVSTLLKVANDEPTSPRLLETTIDRDLETICLKCLDKDPGRRYGSAEALADDLDRWGRGEPIRARPLGWVGRAWRWRSRKPGLAAASAALAASLIAILALSIVFAVQRSRAFARNKTLLAESYLDKGQTLCEEGDVVRGMLWLARSMEEAPARNPELQNVIRANLGAWHPPTPTLRRFFTNEGTTRELGFSADGSVLMIDESSQLVKLLRFPGLEPVTQVKHGRGDSYTRAAALSPDASMFATAWNTPQSGGTVARLWDAVTGEPLRNLAIPTFDPRDGKPVWNQDTLSEATQIRFSRDGTMVVTCDLSRVQSWDAATGKPLHQTLRGLHKDWIEGLDVSPDGKWIATGSRDQTARVWDLATGKPVTPALPNESWVRSVRFSPDGTQLLVGSYDGNARLWNVAAGTLLGKPMPHGASVEVVAFSRDGRRFATGGGYHVLVWTTETGSPVGHPLRHAQTVRALAFHPDGEFLVTGSGDSQTRIWSLPEAVPPLDLVLRHDDPVFAAAYSPDGMHIASVTFRDNGQRTVNDPRPRSKVWLWDAAAGKQLGDPFPSGEDQETPARIAFSPDGKSLALLSEFWDFKTGRERSVLHHWNLETRKPIGPPMVQRMDCSQWAAGVERLAFSADGKSIRVADRQGLTQEWDAATGQPIGEPQKTESLNSHPEAASADGSCIFRGRGEDNTASVQRKKKDGQGIAHVQHRGQIYGVAVTPDGAMLLTGSDDRTARLWDAATLKPVGPPLKFAGSVRSVAFNPSGTSYFAASLDGIVRIRTMPPIAEGNAELLPTWVQFTTGAELWGSAVQTLRSEGMAKRKEKLDQLGGPPLP